MSTPSVTTLPAPSVRLEPCPAFQPDPAGDPGVCAGCGWPGDDHDAPAA